MLLGYARVSKDKQDESLQLDALHRAGCERVYVDKMSGAIRMRPQLEQLLSVLRSGDKVVIWKLDRLGRSLIDLIQLVERFKAEGVDLQILTGEFVADTSTATGELTFHMFAALAQYERRLIQERTLAGLAAARERGRIGGRPRALKPTQVERAIDLLDSGASYAQAALEVKANRATLFRYVKAARGAAVPAST